MMLTFRQQESWAGETFALERATEGKRISLQRQAHGRPPPAHHSRWPTCDVSEPPGEPRDEEARESALG
jgi:hypothetical protein